MLFRRHQEDADRRTGRLVALFALVVVVLVVAVNAVLALAYWLTFAGFARGLPDWFIETNTALVLLFVLGGCWVETMRVKKGGAHVAELAGARPAQPGGNDDASRREQRFVNIVLEMSIASGHRPAPQAWVLPRDEAINAFAAGWGADDAVIVVTRGALERLTREELTGVVAHEFSHLAHGDTRLNMRLVGLVWGLQMIWGLGTHLWSEDERGRRGPGALAGLALMGVGSLGWLAGRLLQAAVSRQREFHADASAVKYARQVDGLGGALRKIADQQVRHVRGLSTAHASALSHLLLSDQRLSGRGWRQWLATHPTLSQRLARLYGRPFEGDELLLAADRVALDEADGLPATPAGPVLHLVGGTAVHGPAHQPSAPMPLEALQHDPLQRPEHFDAAEREREALRRIEQWYGMGEWQAAILALSFQPQAADATARWSAWRAATADLHVAAAVREEIEALSPAARRRVVTLLIDRARRSPDAQRRRLLNEWRQRRRRVEHPTAAGRWRSMAVRHAFAPADLSPRPARGTLATQGSDVRAATRAMAAVLSRDAGRQAAWHAKAIALLEAAGLPPLPRPGAGLAPSSADLRVHAMPMAALRVRRLTPMQRPLLLRAWMEAARTTGLLDDAEAADVLDLARARLDVPAPEALRA